MGMGGSFLGHRVDVCIGKSSTYESVDAEEDKVDGHDDSAVDVDDGACIRVVIDEQKRQQSLLVRRVTKQITRYTQRRHQRSLTAQL